MLCGNDELETESGERESSCRVVAHEEEEEEAEEALGPEEKRVGVGWDS